jgi:hypothetical protein
MKTMSFPSRGSFGFVIALGLLTGGLARAELITNVYESSDTWLCPEGVATVRVEVWGGGGGGGAAYRTNSSSYGGGGGGGAYARLDAFTVTPGSNYVFVVGAGGGGGTTGEGAAGNGGATYFIDPAVLHANGGSGGGNANSGTAPRPAGGAGGAAGTTGDAMFAGGSGGTTTSGTAYASQGGGSGGSDSNGNNGSFNIAGETAAVTGGGPGGAANATASVNGPGQIPSTGPGGGGGGARKNSTGTELGGAGRSGRVRLIFDAIIVGTNTMTTIASSANPSAPGQTVSFTATITPSIGLEIPTGTVQFKTNGVALGAPVAVTPGAIPAGTASISTSDLTVEGSPYAVTAEYTATGSFNSSSGTLPSGQVVAVVTQFDWSNVGSGDWNTPGNWSPPGPPIGAVARVDNGGTANVTTDALYPVTNLRVGYATGGTSGTLNIGANLTATAASEIGRSGTGSLNITNGLLSFSGPTTTTFRFGVLAAGVGTVTQSGGTVASAGTVFVGVQGNGSYNLTGGSLLASNNLTVGSSAGGVGTINQGGGSIIVGSSVAASGQAFVGQSGTGTFNLSAGTLAATAFSIGQNSGAIGVVNQSGGTIDLLNGPAGPGSMSIGVVGTGTYSISNGTLLAQNLTVMVSSNGVSAGTLNLAGNAGVNCTGALFLGLNGIINFAFRPDGVAQMNFAGAEASVADVGSQIFVDGSAYTGGAGSFTLINAASFVGEPTITLNNFALGATSVWDTNNGNFIVTVGTPVSEPPTISYSIDGTTLTLGWPGYAGWFVQSNSVSLADTNAWFDVPGTGVVTNLNITISPAVPKVFYRLRNP